MRKACLGIFGSLAFIGFLGMLCVNDNSDYWWVTLTISFGVFLLGCAGAAIADDFTYFKSNCFACLSVVYVFVIQLFKHDCKSAKNIRKRFGNKVSYKSVFNFAKNYYYEV